MQDDNALLKGLRDGEQSAFEDVFAAYSDRIFRLAAGLLGDENEAEGVVQDTFLRLFESLDQFEGRSGLGTWLYRVAYNNCIDRLRRRRPTRSIDEEPDGAGQKPLPIVFVDWTKTPERVFESAETSEQLAQAISLLPEKLRSTFVLREVEGLSTAETAAVLNTTEGAVKVQIHRARLLLREHLSGYFGERLAAAKETSDEL